MQNKQGRKQTSKPANQAKSKQSKQGKQSKQACKQGECKQGGQASKQASNQASTQARKLGRETQQACKASNASKQSNTKKSNNIQDKIRPMLSEVGHLLDVRDGEGKESALWGYVVSWFFLKRKGYRCNFNRFQGVVRDGRSLLDVWTLMQFRCELLALECDMLGGVKMRTHLQIKDRSDPDADKSRTSAVQVDEKAIKQCSQNAVAIAVLVLGDHRNKRVLAAIVHGAEEVSRWHGEQNVECRDVQRGSQWLLKQISGGFMKHCYAVLTSWQTPASTSECGFLISREQAKALHDEEVLVEDDAAEICGQLSAFNTVARLKRWAMVLGSWDFAVFQMLDPALRQECLQRFERQHQQHQQLLAIERPTKALLALLKRACWHMVSVQQVVMGFKENNWSWSSDMNDVLLRRSLSCFGTQVIEDINNVQKNSAPAKARAKAKANTKFRRPTVSYSQALIRGVVSKIHRFKKVSVINAVTMKRRQVPEQWFKPSSASTESIPLSSVASYNEKADWHSPTSATSGAPAADLALVDYVLGNAWHTHQHHHHQHHHHHYHHYNVPQTVFAHRGLDKIDWTCLYVELCFGFGFVKVAVEFCVGSFPL